MPRYFFRFISLILCLIPITSVAETQEVKAWGVVSIFGSFTQHPNWRYYLEPQMRFIDNHYKYDESLYLAGLGYQFTPDVVGYIGPTAVIAKNNRGQFVTEYRLWQQLIWQAWQADAGNANYRARLEERRRNDIGNDIAYRLRQRVWARFPISQLPGYALSVFDEVFFNFNHPQWVSPRFLAQNRAFIGISKRFSRTTSLDMGYLNQAIFSRQNQSNHVLFAALTINL